MAPSFKPTEKDVTFDDLMSQMGVRRMGRVVKSPQKLRDKPKEHTPTPKQRADSQREVARQVLQAPPAPARTTATDLVGRINELERQLTAVHSALNAEQEARVQLKVQRDVLQEERDAAISRADEIERRFEEQHLHLDRLRRRLSGAEAPASPRLVDVLEKRGVEGLDEASFLIRGLLASRQLDGLISVLQAEDSTALLAWLEDRVALLCESHTELLPPGRAGLTVPAKRCEVCGGSEIKRSVRDFIDGLLVNGMTRVSIVGGSPRGHRMLRQLVQHRGLKLQLVPYLSRRTPGQIRSDLDNSDVVLLWQGTGIPQSEQYSGGPARVISVEHRSIARFLGEAAEQLR
ncbi:MAG: hypothetical protein ACI8RZ_004708 [Myxococcota bacterium]|jgi:hypothetical protein